MAIKMSTLKLVKLIDSQVQFLAAHYQNLGRSSFVIKSDATFGVLFLRSVDGGTGHFGGRGGADDVGLRPGAEPTGGDRPGRRVPERRRRPIPGDSARVRPHYEEDSIVLSGALLLPVLSQCVSKFNYGINFGLGGLRSC